MRRHLLAAGVVITALVSLGDGADARWTGTPPALSRPGANAVDPVTAVGPDGSVALVWRLMDTAGNWRIQMRVFSNGSLARTQTLSRAGQDAFAPDVAVDGTGRVVAVWSQRDESTGGYTVLGRSRSAGGTLSTFRFLSAGVGSGVALRSPDPQVELDSTGAAVAAWQAPFDGTYRAVARSIAADDALAPTWQTLSRGQVAASPVTLAVASDGVATVAWARSTGADTRIETRTRTSGGALGSLRVLSPAGQDSTTPIAAVAPGGEAVVAWVRNDTAEGVLYARLVSAAGVPEPLRKVSLTDTNVVADPATGWGDVAMGDSGAVIVWQQAKPDSYREVAVRGLGSASTLSPVRLAGVTWHAYQPQVVALPGGEALVAFTQRDETFWDRVVVRIRASDGSLGPVQTLSPFGGDAGLPDLAVNDAGRAAAIWVRDDGVVPGCCDRVQDALGP